MHSANGLSNYLSSLLGNPAPWLHNIKNWSHWRQQMSKQPPNMEIHESLSLSIWPELSRWVVFYMQGFGLPSAIILLWRSFIFPDNPTTYKSSCLCSHSKHCSVAGPILVFGNQSSLMRSSQFQQQYYKNTPMKAVQHWDFLQAYNEMFSNSWSPFFVQLLYKQMVFFVPFKF